MHWLLVLSELYEYDFRAEKTTTTTNPNCLFKGLTVPGLAVRNELCQSDFYAGLSSLRLKI